MIRVLEEGETLASGKARKTRSFFFLLFHFLSAFFYVLSFLFYEGCAFSGRLRAGSE